jgi:predicted dehydrogenase
MTNLRVVVVGQGLIGRQRAEALLSVREKYPVDLVATVDPDAPSSGHVPHFASLHELDDIAFDAAVISVPHDLSAEIALGLLGRGKAVLVEKPLGLTLAQAERIRDAAAGLDRPSFVGYNYRFLPTIVRAFQALHAGEIGRLRSVDLMLAHGGHPRSSEGWKLRPERAGGGVIIDPGTHLIDLLRCAVPEARLAYVGATRGFWPTGIEEDTVAAFRADQVLATVRVSHIRWVSTFRVELFGEDGYAVIEGRGGTYGAQTLRLGRRWAWHDSDGASQRETEQAWDFGVDNSSLTDELSSVAEQWLYGSETPKIFPHPATMDEATEVARVCDHMYREVAAYEVAP